MDAETALMHIYCWCAKVFRWDLRSIDETNFETLIDFLTFDENDPNERTINGRTYRRAQGVPQWL